MLEEAGVVVLAALVILAVNWLARRNFGGGL
jgi:hypothetical protein